jgi:formylglycine-generating enzyme required for sulfatase activity
MIAPLDSTFLDTEVTMRPFLWTAACLAIAIAGLCLLPPAVPAPASPTRFALVVGVNEYDHDSLHALKYAVNDATALRDVLEKGGYRVVLLTEPEAKANKDDSLRPTKANVEVHLTYYLGKYELTQEQYQAVTGNNPSSFKGVKLPVESVSWDDADGYTKQLTKKLGGGLLIRLPTEAEWEYACRCGALLKDSLPFHLEYGPTDSLPASAANYDNFKVGTKPVGSYRPNRFGLYDMHGNVEEWCQDRYGDYPTRKVSDPAGVSEGSSRVIRGGCWINRGQGCRSASRLRREPSRRDNGLDVRVALVPSAAR